MGLGRARLRVEPSSMLLPISLAIAAQAAIALDDAALAAALAELVLPYQGWVPRMALVGASLGPIDRQLGCLLAVAGDPERGVALVEDAIAQADAMGALPWSAWARYDLAALCPGRGDAVETASRLADRLELAPLRRRLDALAGNGPVRASS